MLNGQAGRLKIFTVFMALGVEECLRLVELTLSDHVALQLTIKDRLLTVFVEGSWA